ncbi:SAM-dependent methyltransferase-like protein [Leptotrombidium deliense]|uniref:Acetylserotonin O-methyltransferase n=1 Tax=Leptotrombidium deliense TaxID=299467 RepID=A0A443S505_9ACAR|nr:SAM-dependent methyltransferase-like protein [Leptotrombidium deliense]
MQMYLELCKTIAGDFFVSVPSGGDCYILKSVLHDWNDNSAIKILRNVREKMNEKSKLLIIESLLPAGNVSHPSKVLDLHLMAVCEGKERTLSDFKKLITQCDLKLNKVITLPVCLTDIIEVVIS